MNVFPRICSSAGVPIDPDRRRAASARRARGSRRRRPRRRRSRGGCGRTRGPARRRRAGDFFASPAFCERPGRASYSARSATTGAPDPAVATNAVGIPATPRVTAKPSFSRTSCEEGRRLRLLERRLGVVPDLPRHVLPARGRLVRGTRPSRRGRAEAAGAAARARESARAARPRKGTCIGRLRTGDVSLGKDSIRCAG